MEAVQTVPINQNTWMQESLDLGVIIVNWNTRDHLKRCLQSLFRSEGRIRFTACVIDNGSTDGSVEMVLHDFPQVNLIQNRANLGYPRANNSGLEWYGFFTPDLNSEDQAGPPSRTNQSDKVPPRYALLLNPDTELSPMALAQMTEFMDKNPTIGVAGPCLRRPDGTLDKACRRSFPTPAISFYRMTGLARLFSRSKRFNAYNLDYLPEDAVHRVDSVVGAYMQVRQEAIEAVGVLDEAFFMYGEDLDWAKRMKDAGWEVWYNGQVEVIHVKEAASSQSIKPRIDFYQAMWIFYRKHYQNQTFKFADRLIMLGVVLFGGIDVAIRLWRYCNIESASKVYRG